MGEVGLGERGELAGRAAMTGEEDGARSASARKSGTLERKVEARKGRGSLHVCRVDCRLGPSWLEGGDGGGKGAGEVSSLCVRAGRANVRRVFRLFRLSRKSRPPPHLRGSWINEMRVRSAGRGKRELERDRKD